MQNSNSQQIIISEANCVISGEINDNQDIPMNKILLTGDRPTGPLHLGHFIGSLKNRLQFQGLNQQYIMIADNQAFTDYFDNIQKIRDNIEEVMLDYLAVGLDPQKNIFFLQSFIPELAELFSYLLNLVTIERLGRNPTVKSEIQQKGYGDTIPAGFYCYPISQAADIVAFKAEIIPVGGDQIPMIEQTNEIVRKFNRIYPKSLNNKLNSKDKIYQQDGQADINPGVLVECKAYLSSTERLVGIDGKAKASKSLNNAIFLSDSAQEIKQKVFQMYTDPNHLKVSDPGNVEGNVVFAYLDAFYEDQEELLSLKAHYQRGGLGDITIKKILNDCLQRILEPIREKRSSINKKDVRELLYLGSSKAKIKAADTLREVKEAMGILYFG